MVGMGFTDDDGWLTQLLVMKHGDISQVSFASWIDFKL
jgi:hypothetical protein